MLIDNVIIIADLLDPTDITVIVPEKPARQPYSDINSKYPSYEDVII